MDLCLCVCAGGCSFVALLSLPTPHSLNSKLHTAVLVHLEEETDGKLLSPFMGGQIKKPQRKLVNLSKFIANQQDKTGKR